MGNTFNLPLEVLHFLQGAGSVQDMAGAQNLYAVAAILCISPISVVFSPAKARKGLGRSVSLPLLADGHGSVKV